MSGGPEGARRLRLALNANAKELKKEKEKKFFPFSFSFSFSFSLVLEDEASRLSQQQRALEVATSTTLPAGFMAATRTTAAYLRLPHSLAPPPPLSSLAAAMKQRIAGYHWQAASAALCARAIGQAKKCSRLV